MIQQAILLHAWRVMCAAKAMAETYESNRQVCKYVHATSRGHEAIQIAAGLQLRPDDFVSPYYRDESLLLTLGFSPYELMLQLLAKAGDPFTGGRSYYCHPNTKREGMPHIPHQSSATGMQAIPATGMAQGVQYLERSGLLHNAGRPVVLCSMGDGSVTEGEVSEALQVAVLHRLPIIYLIQDNDWGISVRAEESRTMDAYEYAAGFKGMERMRVDGSLFEEACHIMESAFRFVREQRLPVLVHAWVPLLGHHTSGVRKEWYRSTEDLEKHAHHDPLPRLRNRLLESGVQERELQQMEAAAMRQVAADFERALQAPEPDPAEVDKYVFIPTPVTEERGRRQPPGAEKVMMVDAALHALEEILEAFPEAIFFGQDVGRRLGGVFREAAALAKKFGDHRVFNTAIQEAYIIGATAGLSATGVKPVVEIQFADYIYPGINQLVSEVAKSCYLSCGKYPVQMVLRVPVGAYGGGGPYHSGCIESVLLSVKGIKIAYPSDSADMKGLMKAAFLDPNPVVMLEHKGLYWSKMPGTQDAQAPEPAGDYVLPFGKGRIVLPAAGEKTAAGGSVCVITYGMGVYWALGAARHFPGLVEIVDLRTLLPLDDMLVYATVKKHGKCLVVTEEPLADSFAEALAGRISQHCFRWLDAPVQTIGSLDLPAVPLNRELEAAMLPSAEKIRAALQSLLSW